MFALAQSQLIRKDENTSVWKFIPYLSSRVLFVIFAPEKDGICFTFQLTFQILAVMKFLFLSEHFWSNGSQRGRQKGVDESFFGG